jgi:hypothetical protein
LELRAVPILNESLLRSFIWILELHRSPILQIVLLNISKSAFPSSSLIVLEFLSYSLTSSPAKTSSSSLECWVLAFKLIILSYKSSSLVSILVNLCELRWWSWAKSIWLELLVGFFFQDFRQVEFGLLAITLDLLRVQPVNFKKRKPSTLNFTSFKSARNV